MSVNLIERSGIERGVHANVHRGSVVPADLRQAVAEPRRVAGRVRVKGLLRAEVRVQALLDHQELVGKAVGREWVLPALPRPRHVRHEHHGLGCLHSLLLVHIKFDGLIIMPMIL